MPWFRRRVRCPAANQAGRRPVVSDCEDELERGAQASRPTDIPIVSLIRKHNRAVAIKDRPVVDVEADALGDGDPLAVAAESDEVGRGVEMLHALDLLFDDRPGVEIGGDVVAGGTNEFDAARVGLFHPTIMPGIMLLTANPAYGSRSGRLARVRASACWCFHAAILPWWPESNTSGTHIP